MVEHGTVKVNRNPRVASSILAAGTISFSFFGPISFAEFLVEYFCFLFVFSIENRTPRVVGATLKKSRYVLSDTGAQNLVRLAMKEALREEAAQEADDEEKEEIPEEVRGQWTLSISASSMLCHCPAVRT